MDKHCPSQAIQRRLEEIEVTFRELEQQGIKLEKLLRDEGGKARVDRASCPPLPGGLHPTHTPPAPQMPQKSRRRSG